MLAWLFPGQGSQFTSMGRFLRGSSLAAAVFEAAEAMSGLPLRTVIEHGPADLLRRPDYLEPAITALQVACVDELRAHGIVPDVVAGYSLGEIGALYCAGCLNRQNTLALAVERGRVLARHARATAWRSTAVSFRRTPEAILMESATGVFTACINSARNITITGEEQAVIRAERELRNIAAMTPVAIDGPWHTPLAREAARECSAVVRGFQFAPARIPLCLSSAGGFETEPEALQSALCRSIDHPIFWTTCQSQLWDAAVRTTLEVAPGHALTCFLRTHWMGRDYTAHFMERGGGRAFDFKAFANAASASFPRIASSQPGEENLCNLSV